MDGTQYEGAVEEGGRKPTCEEGGREKERGESEKEKVGSRRNDERGGRDNERDIRDEGIRSENGWMSEEGMVIDWYEESRVSKEELFMRKIKIDEHMLWIFGFLSFALGLWGFLLVSKDFWLSLLFEAANMLGFWLISRRTRKLKSLYYLIVLTLVGIFIL